MPASARPPLAESRRPPSLPQLLGRLFDDLPGVVSDRVHLLTLEMRRATRALVKVLVLSMVAGLLAITAWLALWAGLAAAAIHFGVPWGWVAVCSVLLNAVLAGVAVSRALKIAPLLALPATIRRLTHGPGEPSARSAQEAAP
jgi:Putative Actinobacterial Holin-X, holin superfamily III